MKQNHKRLLSLLLAVLLVAGVTSCGSSHGASEGAYAASSEATYEESAYEYDSDYGYYMDEPAMADEAEWTDETARSSNGTISDVETPEGSIYDTSRVKIIYTANLSVEALDLDTAIKNMQKLVDELGGYYESSDRGSNGNRRYASFTVRIPSGKYRVFLDSWTDNENCTLTSMREDSENVGTQYFDMETRLNTLRNKMDRLQNLLSQATEMEDILTLENAISETEYEIEYYTSSLNRYDSLVDYATIQIDFTEVVKLTEVEEETFLHRLGQNFRWGMQDVAEALQELAYWIAYNLVGILIFAAVVAAAVILILRYNKRQNARKQALRDAMQRVARQQPGVSQPQETEEK